ncbi:hypothetical protein SSCG_03844 [Streptomyces clavuligerus]|nr:hypothetical protein SSCG_03844 [Streptomyces clavuligerus]
MIMAVIMDFQKKVRIAIRLPLLRIIGQARCSWCRDGVAQVTDRLRSCVRTVSER